MDHLEVNTEPAETNFLLDPTYTRPFGKVASAQNAYLYILAARLEFSLNEFHRLERVKSLKLAHSHLTLGFDVISRGMSDPGVGPSVLMTARESERAPLQRSAAVTSTSRGEWYGGQPVIGAYIPVA